MALHESMVNFSFLWLLFCVYDDLGRHHFPTINLGLLVENSSSLSSSGVTRIYDWIKKDPSFYYRRRNGILNHGNWIRQRKSWHFVPGSDFLFSTVFIYLLSKWKLISTNNSYNIIICGFINYNVEVVFNFIFSVSIMFIKNYLYYLHRKLQRKKT